VRIPARKALLYSGRLVRSKLVRHGLILGYHRINELAWDPFRLCVSPANFSSHLDVLHAHANVLPLEELLAARAAGCIPPRSVAITFDDGYEDNLSIATPRLEDAGFPATFFISTGCLGREFWWDTLTRMAGSLNPGNPLALAAGNSTFIWPPAGSAQTSDVMALLQALYRFLMPLGAAARAECLADLAATAGNAMPGDDVNRVVTESGIGEMAAGGLVSIGSHSVTHPKLALLPPGQQHNEIMLSKQTLEALTGKPVNGFSFPHGSLTEATTRLIRDCGYRYACASQNDVVWRNSNPYCLPRIWVPDSGATAFRKLLRSWL